MKPLWTEFSHVLSERGHAPPCGVVAATLAEADTAVAAVGVPLCARPLDPVGEYALAVANYPADAELAFDRARRLSPTGRVLFQPHRPGPVCALYAQPGAKDQGDLLLASVHHIGRLALLPIQYGLSTLPETPPWREMAEAGLETLRHARHLPPTPTAFLFGTDPVGLPLHAFHFGAHDAILVHVLDQIRQKDLPVPLTLRFFEPPTGRITRIDGLEAARAIPGVIEVALRAEIGHLVRHLTSIAARDAIGHVLAETPEAAAAALAKIHFETSPCL